MNVMPLRWPTAGTGWRPVSAWAPPSLHGVACSSESRKANLPIHPKGAHELGTREN